MSIYFNLRDKEIVELEHRFWKKVKLPDQINNKLCWEWIGARDKDGYGRIRFLDNNKNAHRISYWLYIEHCQSDLLFIPSIEVCHKCDNPPCINPSHLFKGTSFDNTQDKCNKGRHYNMLVTHCPYGHEYSKENTYINPTSKSRQCRICIKIRNDKRPKLIDYLKLK